MKYNFFSGLAMLAFSGISAFAAIPACSTLLTFDQLVAARSCSAGPSNSVTFSDFNISVSSDMQKLIGVTTFVNQFDPSGNPGLYGFVISTGALPINTIVISFKTVCDNSCQFNDGFFRSQGTVGFGTFVVNGQVFPITSGAQFLPAFANIREISTTTFYTASGPSLAGLSLEMEYNIIPSGYPSNSAGSTGQSCPIVPPATSNTQSAPGFQILPSIQSDPGSQSGPVSQ